MVDATCGEDTGSKIINKDNFSGFYKFSNEIYGMMDDYYCTDVCACKVEAGTFDGADANQTQYYATLNMTGNISTSFQWCSDSLTKVAKDFGISLPDQLNIIKDDNFDDYKKKYDENWEDDEPELNSNRMAA